MVIAVGRGIYRAHGRSDVRPKVRKPLTSDMLVQGWGFFANRGREWSAVWMARAVLSSTVQGLRDLGVWERSSAPRLLSYEKGCCVF